MPSNNQIASDGLLRFFDAFRDESGKQQQLKMQREQLAAQQAAQAAQQQYAREQDAQQMGLLREKFDYQKGHDTAELDIKRQGLLKDKGNSGLLTNLDIQKKQLDIQKAQNEMNPQYVAQKQTAEINLQTDLKRQKAMQDLDATISQLEDPNIPQDQKVMIGQQILKKLNDPEMSDAVGKEEVERLGAYLKNFSISRPGSTFGRDIPRFTSQVRNKREAISLARKGASQPQAAQQGSGGLIPNAVAAPPVMSFEEWKKANGR